MKSLAATECVGALLLVLLSAPVLAQQAGGFDRPYRGLFASQPAQPVRTSLVFTATLAEAYDDNALADVVRSVVPAAGGQSGYYSLLNAAADYGWSGGRTQFGASASSALRYYNQLGELRSVSHSGAIGVSAGLPGQATLLINQTAAYSPSYLFALFPGLTTLNPGDALPAAPDYSVDESQSYAYGTDAAFMRGVGRTGRLSFSGRFQYTDFVHEAEGRRDLTSFGGGASFSRNVSRRGALRLGYRVTRGDSAYVQGADTTEHVIDIGMDYTKRLSATRRATFSFNVGSSAADTPGVLTAGDRPLGRQYRVSGGASGSYQFGRSWQARGSYQRGLEHVPALGQPVYSDGVTAGLDGLLSRRIDVLAFAAYSSGASALNRNGLAFDTYTGDLRFRYALGRNWAAYAEYLYYFYEFRGTTQLPAGLARGLERNGVRVGLMLWAPVVGR